MQFSWEERYAQRTKRMTASAIRELLKLTELPDFISFAGGLPAPEVFPVKEVADATARILHDFGPKALQYGTTEGYRPLRELVARMLSDKAVRVTAENVLITTGSQQALDLLGKIFIDPGDFILTESPTYLGALQAWNAYGAEYVTVPLTEEGLNLEQLEGYMKTGPKFVYLLPNFQNPSGISMPLEVRHKVVELADRYRVAIVEDDPYRRLRYEGEDLPALIELDGQRRDGETEYMGNVIYLGTFSKTLAPGLRLGWVVAPLPVISKLAQAKQGVDLHTSSLNQIIAYEVARNGFLDEHILHIRKVYGEHRDIMLAAMAEHFPAGVHWTRPQGGMFLWVTLPEGMDTSELLKEAVKQKVAFVPGNSFHPNGEGANTMRLNFSNASPENIREGIRRLGAVLAEHMVPAHAV